MKKRRDYDICPVCNNYGFDLYNAPDMTVCKICKWELDILQEEEPDYKGG